IDELLPGKDKLNVINTGAAQVNSTLENGDADAAIVFQPDFGQQVFAGQNPAVQIILEGSDPTVASAMSDLTQSFTHQLGVALAAIKSQSGQPGQTGQGLSSTLSGSLPFSVPAPQYLHGGQQYTF